MNTKTHPKLIDALISGNGHFSVFSEVIFQEARDGDDHTARVMQNYDPGRLTVYGVSIFLFTAASRAGELVFPLQQVQLESPVRLESRAA